MIETFKQIIISILFIGIFISILELIIPKTNSKKYIYVIVGIVIVITIITPIKNIFSDEKIDFEAFFNNFETESVISNIEDKDLVKEQFLINFKKDIESKLTIKGLSVISTNLNINDNYELDNLRINIKKMKNKDNFKDVTDIVEYINKEYSIDYSKIEVIEGE